MTTISINQPTLPPAQSNGLHFTGTHQDLATLLRRAGVGRGVFADYFAQLLMEWCEARDIDRVVSEAFTSLTGRLNGTR